MAVIGVIGGSGLYDMDLLTDRKHVSVDTPFGRPSGEIVTGRVGSTDVAFLPRHGIGHALSPSEIPFRANIHAMKQLDVTHLLSISAVGSLTERYPPLTLVCPDQIIDRTVFRERTFFDRGVVAHVGLADPFCTVFTDQVVRRGAEVGLTIQGGGAYLCIEGPQFSTRAESDLYRAWGASVIGMTAMPEARLAREAEICYVQIAMVTDFDVWHTSEAPVTVETVIKNLHQNAANAKLVLTSLLSKPVEPQSECGCGSALANAIVTNRDLIPPETRTRIALLADKYLQ